jgi:hypothetical protein
LTVEAGEPLRITHKLPEVAFLTEAARYFETRPTGGEDAAHWSNVFNAKNCREAADTLERQAAEIERLRESLLGIALSDRYRRYPKQHEDGGVRGQSGLRAIRALTGQHGSYLSDDDVVRLDKVARAALTGEDT